MLTFLQDVRYGVRVLLKSPGLSAAAILTLALGIGANIAIFSFVDAIWLRPLAVSHPERVVRIYTSCPTPSGIDPRCDSSSPDMMDVKAQARSLEDVAFYERRGAILIENGDATLLLVNQVSDNWLEMMGVKPAVGRIFTAAEQARPDTPPEVLLSYSFWQRHYGGDQSVVGRTVTFSGRKWSVIGVLPREFRGTEAILDPELTVSMSSWNRSFQSGDSRLVDREYRAYEAFGRLRDGASVETLNAELATITARLTQAYPKTNRLRQFTAVLEGQSRGESRRRLALLLLAIAGLVLLIACANVANLLLARGEHRRREVATRLALGATRLRVARQFFLESALLVVIAGLTGLVVGKWTVDALPGLVSGLTVPISIDTRFDVRVLLFAISAAFCAVFLFGVAPAMDASRTDLVSTLKSQAAGGAEMGRRPWLRDGMVVMQMGVSLMLIVSTGLLLRTMFAMQAADPGFAAHQPMLIADVITGPHPGVTPAQHYRTVQQDLAALPGVRSVAIASRIPLSPSGGGHSDEVLVPGKLQPNGRGISVKSAYVSTGYFETIGTRLLRGRTFGPADSEESARAVVINQSMARKFWGEGNAIGQHLQFGRADGKQTGADFEVIGIVQDGKYNDLAEESYPYLFLNLGQFRDGEATVIVATAGDPAALAGPVRRQLRDQEGMTVLRLSTMREFMRYSMFANRLAAQLVAVMGALGMLLAAIGLYGVISYLVGRRTREIGVRMALGAPQRAILAMFLERGVLLALAGIVLGVGAALAMSKVIGSLLYGVSPHDPLTFVAASVLLLLVAATATWIPARRATRIEPMEALRYE